jgi:hypothetical protein
MALFNDGPISTTLDLQNYESGILGVASTEGIDLSGKMALAQDEIANEVLLFLLRRVPVWDFQWSERRARGTSDVVVTAPLKQWHVHKALALVYRDAYNNQLNDRYLNKWNEYESLAKASSETYLHIGVGLVGDPLGKPGVPILSAVGGSGGAATYYVAVTWTNTAGQESNPSDLATITTLAGQQMAVTILSPPANAAGWNVYVGQSPDTISLQNAAAIGVNDSWILGTLVQGKAAGSGQAPMWYFVDHRIIERG